VSGPLLIYCSLFHFHGPVVVSPQLLPSLSSLFLPVSPFILHSMAAPADASAPRAMHAPAPSLAMSAGQAAQLTQQAAQQQQQQQQSQSDLSGALQKLKLQEQQQPPNTAGAGSAPPTAGKKKEMGAVRYAAERVIGNGSFGVREQRINSIAIQHSTVAARPTDEQKGKERKGEERERQSEHVSDLLYRCCLLCRSFTKRLSSRPAKLSPSRKCCRSQDTHTWRDSICFVGEMSD
jgi:hypothetical protein